MVVWLAEVDAEISMAGTRLSVESPLVGAKEEPRLLLCV